MKNKTLIYLLIFILTMIAAYFFGLGIRAIKETADEINALNATIVQQKKDIEANEKKSLADIAEREARIADLMGEVDSANTVIARLEEKQAIKDGKIKDLDAALKDAKTDAERVPILVSLVDEWRGKYTIASAEIIEIKGQRDKLKLSLDNQAEISAKYMKLWQDEQTLRKNVELKLGIVEKKVKRSKLVMWGAIGASVLYSALEK